MKSAWEHWRRCPKCKSDYINHICNIHPYKCLELPALAGLFYFCLDLTSLYLVIICRIQGKWSGNKRRNQTVLVAPSVLMDVCVVGTGIKRYIYASKFLLNESFCVVACMNFTLRESMFVLINLITYGIILRIVLHWLQLLMYLIIPWFELLPNKENV